MRFLKSIDRVLLGTALVVITMTLATVGLVAASEYQRLQRLAATAAGAKHHPAGPQDRLTLQPAAPDDDPELMRLDRSNEHHG